jgi:pseudo-rSAM protein
MNQLFQTLKIQWTYYLYIHYLNAAGKNDRLRFAAEHGVRLKVPVTFPLNNKKMEETLDTFSATNIKFTLLFPVRNVEEFQMADELIKKFQPLTSEFHPLFDGSNLDFFRENLFIQKEDIEKERPSLKEIHARGVVNAFNFGNLIIRPDGRCYANVNAVPLGELGKDSLYNILFKEMEHGRSWRKIRKYISPCKSCTFEKLCPPISNYNSVIGRYNLCHIYEHEKKIIQKYKIKQEEQ